jgi:hypothetical protein
MTPAMVLVCLVDSRLDKAKFDTTAPQSVTIEFGSVIKWHVVKAAQCSANPAVRGHCHGKVIFTARWPASFFCPMAAPAVAAGVPPNIKEPST